MKWLAKLFSRIRAKPEKTVSLQLEQANIDNVEISLCGLDMLLKRKFYSGTPPHEVSLYVPRAEIRRTTYEGTDKRTETEIILNSITIVHAPRHPLANEPAPIMPPGAKKKIP